MAAFDDKVDALPASHRDPDAPLAWIANEKTKPGRPGRTALVAQASSQLEQKTIWNSTKPSWLT